ncbi:DUF58 domain-containing protein [Aliagarivorans taiwanensis]|uniref:DUF58 domain-containing protein n=1 Tax=Aliagarivorans taiwanensis TaxID=561966 RepID=UPI00042A89F0|nr:DUF58 domain-containing protein [Aliagarivorans taiwanensis]
MISNSKRRLFDRERWLRRRLPPAASTQLGRRNLFILPTGFGCCYLIGVLVLYLLSTNYQNNLVLLLALFLLVLWVVTLHLCHFNLSGLQVTRKTRPLGLAGDTLVLELQIHKPASLRGLALAGSISGLSDQHWRLDDGHASLSFTLDQRGVYPLPRLKLSSSFPFGLFRCWTWLDLDCESIVAPTPEPGYPCPRGGEQEATNHTTQSHTLQDEFAGLVPYRTGERLSLLSWKALAAGRGLQRKSFESYHAQALVLDESSLQQLERELRYRVLCHWVLQLSQQGQRFSLSVAGQQLPMGEGEAQKQAALEMLARAPR